MSSARGLVIDASAAADLLRSTPHAESVREATAEADLHAPELMDLEVLSAIGRWERAGQATNAQASAAVSRLEDLPVTRHGLRPLLRVAWDLRQSLRIADAYYVALARSLGIPLVTSDGRLGRAVRDQALCEVVVIE